MKDFQYVISNFFTHKDFLAPADQIPGTLFTPLHFIFEAVVLILLFSAVFYVSSKKERIRPTFIGIWISLVVLEFVMLYFDNATGRHPGMDWQYGLSLYPCSIFMYAMPFAIWGKGIAKKAACGYVCTLGLLGALVNFLYPMTRLTDYSCISLPAFHTFYFHGSMLFTCLVMLRSHYHSYMSAARLRELFYPCIPSLLVSIPANILNYSPIDSDYMYFKGYFPALAVIFAGLRPVAITLILYGLYILIPALFYLPGYLRSRKRTQEDSPERFSIPQLLMRWNIR